MNDDLISEFACLLEEAGYEDALTLVQNDLVSLARCNDITLVEAAWEYSDQDEEQDTSWQQLFCAMQKIDPSRLGKFDVKI